MLYYKILYDLFIKIYMILLTIISNNILLGLSIVLIYHFIFISLFSQYIKLYYLLLIINFPILYN